MLRTYQPKKRQRSKRGVKSLPAAVQRAVPA